MIILSVSKHASLHTAWKIFLKMLPPKRLHHVLVGGDAHHSLYCGPAKVVPHYDRSQNFFLQTVRAENNVYVLPPLESCNKGRCLWILLTATYELINTNEKWQVLSDTILTVIVFSQTRVLTQLFDLIGNNRLVSIIGRPTVTYPVKI